MTKIYFNYGSMNSGKSLDLIRVAYNYSENEISTLIIKPITDTRSEGFISSRAGLNLPALETPVDDPNKLSNVLKENIEECKVILVEECNFYSKESIDVIINLAYDLELESVMFYGLKVDFRGELFPGSQRVIERADKLIESTSICWCGRKARQNSRVVNGKISKVGPQVLIEDGKNIVEYVTLCNYHYYKEMLD